MRGFALPAMVMSAVILLAACGSMPDDAGGATARPRDTGGSSAGASGSAASPLAPGKPVVTVNGSAVQVAGVGTGISGPFPLSGKMLMKSSACEGTGVIPFVWLFTKSGDGRGTYVDAETHLANLAGEYYVRVEPGTKTCAWTIDFAPE